MEQKIIYFETKPNTTYQVSNGLKLVKSIIGDININTPGIQLVSTFHMILPKILKS